MNINLYDSTITWAERNYDDEVTLYVKKYSELSIDEKLGILTCLLGDTRYSPKIKEILNSEDYFTNEQIKEKKGVKFSNQDKLYFSNYSLEELNEYNYQRYISLKEPGLFAFVSLDKNNPAKLKLDELKKKKEAKEQKAAKDKKLREIEKAKKLLARQL